MSERDSRWARAEERARLVRLDLFGDPHPPFRSLVEALAWLETESLRHQVPSTETSVWEPYFEAKLEAMRRLQAAVELAPIGRTVHISEVTIIVYFPVQQKDGRFEVRGVHATSERLCRLADESETIAEHVDSFRDVASAAILIGTERSLELGMDSGTRVSNRIPKHANELGLLPDRVTVEVVEGDDASLGRLLRSGKLKGGLTMHQRNMLDFVASLQRKGVVGEPPSKGRPGVKTGVREYWTVVMTAWNELHPGSRFEDCDGAKKLYWRAIEAKRAQVRDEPRRR